MFRVGLAAFVAWNSLLSLAVAQNVPITIGTTDTLPSIIVKLIASTSAPSSAQSFQTLSDPIIIPNYLEANAQFVGRLRAFDQIPNRNGTLSEGAERTILFALNKISQGIEISTRSLSQHENRELSDAKKLLFRDGRSGVPTQLYTSYLTFKAQYDQEVERLRTEKNSAARSAIQLKINTIQQNWEAVGNKADVDAALAKIAFLDERGSADLISSWQQSIADGSRGKPGDLSDALVRTNWVRVAVSLSTAQGVSAAIIVDGSRIPVPGPTAISFDFTRVSLRRTALEADALADRTWRNRSGFVLSDGNPESDDSTELLPRIVQELVVVKNMEVTFGAAMSRDALEQLQTGSNISLFGLPLQDASSRFLGFQNRYLALPRPLLVGYVIANVPKIPNPAPGRSWN